MGEKEAEVFSETLSCLKRGYYFCGEEKVELRLTEKERARALVFLPQDLPALGENVSAAGSGRPAQVRMVNSDTLGAARMLCGEREGNVAVLNFANSVHPGGGVRRGTLAQEEDICRRSSLMESLESKEASAFYGYNYSLYSPLASDAVIVSPQVEVFRRKDLGFLPGSFLCSVLTCAAPDLRLEPEITEEDYRTLFLSRIRAVLTVAASLGYRRLVLGAWGCGAFRNDAAVVSDLFYTVLTEWRCHGLAACTLFEDIVFAVPYTARTMKNFYEFARNFSGFRASETVEEPVPDEPAPTAADLQPETDAPCCTEARSRIRGSFLGGAVGDALGYPVEFLSQSMIRSRYGKNGITQLHTDPESGLALVSDDTQMTLFTAQGLLNSAETPLRGVEEEYLNWLRTQEPGLECKAPASRLLSETRLFAARAPGNTCLSALESINSSGVLPEHPVENRINDSKGCGGIMRIAPAGWAEKDPVKAARLAAEISAVTHGHPLGYLPSAFAAHMISECVWGGETLPELKELALRAEKAVSELFPEETAVSDLTAAVDKAIELSENDRDDQKNIRLLGGGWVAEETLAIALYCALRHKDSFSAAVIAAVNHSGDSDSTGAVTGNILGAYLGETAIENRWLENLEFRDLILHLSDAFVPAPVPVSPAAETAPETENMPDTGRSVLIVAGTKRELRRLGSIAAILRRDGVKTPLCLVSDDGNSRAFAAECGFEKTKYAFMFTAYGLSDRASEAAAAAEKTIKDISPDAVLCFSGGPSGFGGAVAASSQHTDCLILSAGIRFGIDGPVDFLRSAADGAALWREAADRNAYETLRSEACEKGSLIPADTPDEDIAKKTEKIIGS